MKTKIHNLLAALALMLVLICQLASAQTFTLLHSFTGNDGYSPGGGLILSGNTLYGTTDEGGTNGAGNVFAVHADGTGFTNLYSFSNYFPIAPNGGLILSGNTLYGTTLSGGTNSEGSVFAIRTDGTGFTNLYSFSGGIDGANPNGGLILSGNTLYGTAENGGYGYGVVFAIHMDGTGFTNLYDFYGNDYGFGDGAGPIGALTLSGKTLYGTTKDGGTNAVGTVFSIHTDGTGYTNFYTFSGANDGAYPVGGLILSGNTLYGAAAQGGSSWNGTLFALSTNGTGFTMLHDFTAPSGSYFTNEDGGNPSGGLIISGNTLYGAANYYGGPTNAGTIFAIHTDGSGFTVLYAFSELSYDPAVETSYNSDGANPSAPLTLFGNILYGTAQYGGLGDRYSYGGSGPGTLFSITLGPLTNTTVQFAGTPTNAASPLTVQFNCPAMDSQSNIITSWNWSFGDGGVSTLQNPSHTYTSVGTFAPVLVATNYFDITVNGSGPAITVTNPTVQFTAGPTNGASPLAVQFTSPAVDSQGTAITSWSWSFGDGGTSTLQNPSHTYISVGTFAPTLVATNSYNDVVIASGTGLTVTNPTVQFTAGPTNGASPLAVQFTSPTVDSQGSAITSWSWSFGDGGTSTLQNPSHTYTSVGTFAPALIATNSYNDAVIGSGPAITVTNPTVQFTAGPTNGASPLTVQFTSPAVDSQGSAITSWSWSFGDGGTSTLQNPSHTYTSVGVFAPTLIATNSYNDAVIGSGPGIAVINPTVQFTASPTNGTAPLTVQFNCPAVDSQGASLTGWNWNFGDGTSSILQNPSHVFSSPGVFQPELIATNSSGVIVIGSGPPITTLFTTNSSEITFTVLHNFTADPYPGDTNGDGAQPNALILSGGTLYGTAEDGGVNAYGAVFSLNTNGTGFTLLHSFSAPSYYAAGQIETNCDGYYPNGGLTLSGNTLYGTTPVGGASGNGVVFSLNIDGTGFTVLHDFSTAHTNFNANVLYYRAINTNSDGIGPNGLIQFGNTLFGTASWGGLSGLGTVFSLNTNGAGFTVIENSFINDEANPNNGMILSGGILYLTAYNGNGTVLAVPTNNPYAYADPLYQFTDGNDGAYPKGGLVLSGNTLYGAASVAGKFNLGSLFAVNTDGTGFTNLHSFAEADGVYPQTALVLSGSTLYGTAHDGGSLGNGTLFAINTNGTAFTVLHNFSALTGPPFTNIDGTTPGGLILSGSTLYGTTLYGGSFGNGTIFAFSIAPSAPQLLSPQVLGSSFAFSFATVSGQSYQVLASPSLQSANWQVVTNISGNGAAAQIVLPLQPNNQAEYFRVNLP